MRKLLAIVLAVTSIGVYANCTTHTLNQGGKITVCTTCCYNGNCNTTCY